MKDSFKIQQAKDGFWYATLTTKGQTTVYGACVDPFEFLNPLYNKLLGLDLLFEMDQILEDKIIPIPYGATSVYGMTCPFLLSNTVMKEYLKPRAKNEFYNDDY